MGQTDRSEVVEISWGVDPPEGDVVVVVGRVVLGVSDPLHHLVQGDEGVELGESVPVPQHHHVPARQGGPGGAVAGRHHQVLADQAAATERSVAPQELPHTPTALQPRTGSTAAPGASQERHPGVVVPLGVRPSHHLARRSPDSTGGVVVEAGRGRGGLAVFPVVQAAVACPLTARVAVTAQACSPTLAPAAPTSLRSPRRSGRRGRSGRGGGGEKTSLGIILTTISHLETI